MINAIFVIVEWKFIIFSELVDVVLCIDNMQKNTYWIIRVAK